MKPWKLLNSETVFEKSHLKIDKMRFELPDGQEKSYFVRNIGHVAKVFGVTKEGQVILIKQFRPGPREVVYELPGGFCDKNEEPIENARREFLEETGYTGDFSFLTSFWSDAYSTMKIYAYLAVNCVKINEQMLDQDEFIEVNLVSKEKLKQMFFEGEMRDIGICALGLEKNKEFI